MGLVLGVGLACLVFHEITFLRNLRTHSPADGKETGTDKEKKKIVLVSRRWSFFLGIVFIGVPQFNSIWSLMLIGCTLSRLGLGLSFVCIGWWMSTLFWAQFKGEWMWWLVRIVVPCFRVCQFVSNSDLVVVSYTPVM